MKRIMISLLLLAFPLPAAAQDWERVFIAVDAPSDSHRVLVLDVDVDRSETTRYRILSTADLLAAALPTAARLSYIADTSLVVSPSGSSLRLIIDGVDPVNAPVGSIVMIFRPISFPTAGGVVTVLFGDDAAVPLLDLAGDDATWAGLQERALHVMVRSPGAWSLLH